MDWGRWRGRTCESSHSFARDSRTEAVAYTVGDRAGASQPTVTARGHESQLGVKS